MVIIDASVINKLFLPNEEGHNTAQGIIQRHILKSEEILVPDLLFYEVANTFVTKTAIPLAKIIRSLAQLDKLKLLIIHPTMEELKKIAKFASDYHVSVYDATYAILAKEKSCDLFTADSKFVKKVNLPFVKHLSEYQS
ncbi:MAG: type II toxin-antitoxin system VapC family toxin [Candidatus Curtissbacteria bacterium]|nr:type II toxin-antitoxin system VapC family toxin [Candidatus Curtissbacteria bacterium]